MMHPHLSINYFNSDHIYYLPKALEFLLYKPVRRFNQLNQGQRRSRIQSCLWLLSLVYLLLLSIVSELTQRVLLAGGGCPATHESGYCIYSTLTIVLDGPERELGTNIR